MTTKFLNVNRETLYPLMSFSLLQGSTHLLHWFEIPSAFLGFGPLSAITAMMRQTSVPVCHASSRLSALHGFLRSTFCGFQYPQRPPTLKRRPTIQSCALCGKDCSLSASSRHELRSALKLCSRFKVPVIRQAISLARRDRSALLIFMSFGVSHSDAPFSSSHTVFDAVPEYNMRQS